MIKLTALVENTTSSPLYDCKHGLSVYIETAKHKILFDVGPNDLFVKNAEKMGIDLKAVDTVIISHGHYDHGGGLAKLLEINKTAKIYIRENGFEPHFTSIGFLKLPIGLDKDLMENDRIVLTGEETIIDDELTLFSGVNGRKLFSSANKKLMMKQGDKITEDSFTHEQNLVIKDGDKSIMLTGCSHNGIVNIVEKYNEKYGSNGTKLTDVIGGFHLYNPSAKKYESDELITAVAAALMETEPSYYTCHCTGTKAYEIMKSTMGDKLGYLSVGTKLEL